MKILALVVAALLMIVVIAFIGRSVLGGGLMFGGKSNVTPTPIVEDDQPVAQLEADKQPQVTLKFTKDAHYVNVSLTNLHAASLEYNLIYDAVVKKNQIQAGVTASAKVDGQSTYSKDQLLGSESSGKFTYHENIKNAVMELTLRDANNRSIFTASYPFTVTPGSSVELKKQ